MSTSPIFIRCPACDAAAGEACLLPDRATPWPAGAFHVAREMALENPQVPWYFEERT